MVNLQTFTFNLFSENTYVVWDETGECVVVDPGNNSHEENAALERFIREKNLTPVAVLNTHCHVDHVMGNRFCTDRWNIPLMAPEGEQSNLDWMEKAAQLFQVPLWGISPQPDRWIKGGEKVEWGKTKMEVLSMPGHSAGHVGFFIREQGLLLSGDVLFAGSIGRTDLPGGSFPVLMQSIARVVLPLGDAVSVYPGHGPQTTIEAEKRSNPFILEYVSR